MSNSFRYASSVLAGFHLEALYEVGGVAGASGNGQMYRFGASYANGPLSLGGGCFHANGGNTTTDNLRTWTSSADPLFNTVINARRRAATR